MKEHILKALCTEVPASFPLEVGAQLQADLCGTGNEVIDFDREHQLACFLKKYEGLPGSTLEGRIQVALGKFRSSELMCQKMNSHYRPPTRGVLGWVFDSARRKIGECVGEIDFRSLDLSEHCGFGKGATFDTPRTRGDVYFKMGNLRPTATRGAIRPFAETLASFPSWEAYYASMGGAIKLSRGARIDTVPKDSKQERVIGVEPHCNVFLQKGVGSVVRKCLKKFGIDLNHGQRLHQDLARQGSITGELATIDLSSASDSISLAVAFDLLPIDLFGLLLDLRSPEYLLDGEWHTCHKLSGMGCGFTFEVESLLFWGLAAACCEVVGVAGRAARVYGDDIIVPTQACNLLFQALEYAGFTVNDEKSYTTGKFRESCGGQYYNGFDVTPVYCRRRFSDVGQLFWLANSLARKAWTALGRGYSRDSSYKRAYEMVVAQVPTCLRKQSAPFLGASGDPLDVCLGGDFDEVMPPRDRDVQAYKWSGWQRSMGSKSYRDSGDTPLLLKHLYLLDRGPEEVALTSARLDPSSIPTAVERWRTSKGLVTRWPNLGPWV